MRDPRPSQSTEELRDADRRDRPLLRPGPSGRGVGRALGEELRAASGCTPRSTTARSSAAPAHSAFRMTVPGGAQLGTRRRDGRRRPADAPPPRDPPLDDARAARRRARARRAARGALGVGGDDLRPLRLRARLARARVRDPANPRRVPGGDRAGRPRPASSTRKRRPGRCRRSTTPSSASRPGCTSGPRRGGSTACSPTRPSSASAAGRSSSPCSRSTARPQAYAIYRLNVVLRQPRPGDHDRHARGRWARLPPRRLRSGATSSTSTGRRPCPPGSSPSTTRSSCCSHGRTSRARRSPTGSGCGSSTSAPRSSARTYAGRRRVVFDVRDEFCPWNEGAGRSRPGEAARTDDEADLALDVSDLARSLPRRLHLPELAARRPRARSCARARSPARTGSSARTSHPGAPRSSSTRRTRPPAPRNDQSTLSLRGDGVSPISSWEGVSGIISYESVDGELWHTRFTFAEPEGRRVWVAVGPVERATSKDVPPG